MAFLGIGKKKQKKSAAAAQATIKQLIDKGQTLSDQQMSTMIYASDGKISTKEKKLLKKANKQENKTARTEIRADKSIKNVASRADARKTAYENGIDPRKWISDTAGHVANGVVGVATAGAIGKVGTAFASRPASSASGADEGYLAEINSRLQGLQNGAGNTYYNQDTPPAAGDFDPLNPTQDKSKLLLIVGAVVVGFLLLNKRK